MSKRTQSIRSMFSGQSEQAVDHDLKRPSLPRVSSGAVRSLKDTFSDVEKEYQALRDKLASGQVAVEIDPSLIDPSPLADRFSEQDAASFEALKTSIRERGQEIPVLLREHPSTPGRYQSAYGHRRVRVARALNIPVKAYVRALSDEDLVVAQGVENSAREDLSFIERAVFARRLEDAGFARALIQSALSVDRAEVSKLVAVARALPGELVDAIGRAPKVGRGRWQSLADAVGSESSLARALEATTKPGFAARETDDRFILALAAAARPDVKPTTAATPEIVTSGSGAEIGRVATTDKQWRLSIRRDRNDGFADYLTAKLPELFQAYEAALKEKQNGPE